MSVDGSFVILCVCTGNVCRSPAAERLLASRLATRVEVRSAGTHALIGQPVSPPMDSLIAGNGADPSRFLARLLNEDQVRSADLILGMTRDHRGEIVELWPQAVRRTFTLKEFARLVAQVDPLSLSGDDLPERFRTILPLAAAQRGPIPDPTIDDIIDPYGQSPAVYREAFSDIEQAVRTVVQVVTTG